MAKEKKRVYPGYMGRAKEAPERPGDHSEVAVSMGGNRFDHSGVKPPPPPETIDPAIARKLANRSEGEDPEEIVQTLTGGRIGRLKPAPIDEPDDPRTEAWRRAVESLQGDDGEVPVEDEEVEECFLALRSRAVAFFREPSEEGLESLARQAVLLLASSHLE